jgi:hypothetical protein
MGWSWTPTISSTFTASSNLHFVAKWVGWSRTKDGISSKTHPLTMPPKSWRVGRSRTKEQISSTRMPDPPPERVENWVWSWTKTEASHQHTHPTLLPWRVEKWVGHEQKANLINFRPPFPPSIPPGAPHPQKNPQKKKEKQNRGWAVSTGVKKVSKAAPSTPSKYFVSISPQVVGFDT